MSDWRDLTLKQVARSTPKSFIDGDWIESPYITTEGNRLIQTGNIGVGHFVAANEKFISDETFVLLKCKEVVPGDVLICRLAEPIGRACIAPNLGVRCITSVDVCILKVDEEHFDKRYIVQRINQDDFLERCREVAAGTTRQRISRTNLGNLRIELPPLPQQRKIARILTTVDNLIEKTEALIAKYQAIKQGMMHDLFTRGVDEHGHLRPPYEEAPELYKQSELGCIPKEWEVASLSRIADVGRGKFTPRPRNDPKYYGGLYPFIQTGDVASSIGRYLVRYNQTLNDLGTSVSRWFPAGTIVVTIAANIADTAILGIPMYLPDSIVGVVVHPGTIIRYIELCLRRAKHALDARAPQSAQKNINLDDLRPLLIPLPGQVEQEWIARLYESNEALLAAEETTLRKLCLQRTGLMQDLLAGKVRVKVDAAEEIAAYA